MDREWAASQQWHESMHLPSDSSKGMYLLEAYHQIHCVVQVSPSYYSFNALNPAVNYGKFNTCINPC